MEHQVYACGAPIMVESAQRDFIARCGLPDDEFYADSFTSEADKHGPRPADGVGWLRARSRGASACRRIPNTKTSKHDASHPPAGTRRLAAGAAAAAWPFARRRRRGRSASSCPIRRAARSTSSPARSPSG